MCKKIRKPLIALVALVLAVFLCMYLAYGIQTGHGTIDVSMGELDTPAGSLKMLLPRPRLPAFCCCMAIRMTMRPAPPTPLSWPGGAWWFCLWMSTATAAARQAC